MKIRRVRIRLERKKWNEASAKRSLPPEREWSARLSRAQYWPELSIKLSTVEKKFAPSIMKLIELWWQS